MYFDDFDKKLLTIEEEIVQISSIITWLATNKARGTRYCATLVRAQDVKEMLETTTEELTERLVRLGALNQRLQDDGENDEDYFE